MKEKGIFHIGMGVSGGEEGARNGERGCWTRPASAAALGRWCSTPWGPLLPPFSAVRFWLGIPEPWQSGLVLRAMLPSSKSSELFCNHLLAPVGCQAALAGGHTGPAPVPAAHFPVTSRPPLHTARPTLTLRPFITPLQAPP